MADWVSQAINPVHFNDLRHAKRLRQTVNVLSEKPTASVPEASGSSSEAKTIYRFWSNPQVKVEAIHKSFRDGVVKRAREQETVLALQDTTDFNFSHHPKTTGLGFINQSQQKGLKVHSSLAVSGDGEPLGILKQHCWSRRQRRGQRGKRRQKPIEQKESYRWLRHAQASEEALQDVEQVVLVGDREADIFDLFTRPRADNSELLIRATQNRKVQHELDYLIPSVEQAPVLGELTVDVPRNPQRPARTAELELRALTVTLEVPCNHPQQSRLEPVQLNVILAQEVSPPANGHPPIRWLLITSLPIDTGEQLAQCVVWYSYRWLIERFHYTLKSGCRFENLQLETGDRLQRALATYNIIAWRLLWLTYRARLTPEASCELVLEPAAWRLLRRKFQPKSRSRKPPTLRQAMRWIAQLGGFLARKHDGEPGVKTLWRGFTTLHSLLEGAQLASSSPSLSGFG